MRVMTSQYEIGGTFAHSHLLSQIVFFRGIIYPPEPEKNLLEEAAF